MGGFKVHKGSNSDWTVLLKKDAAGRFLAKFCNAELALRAAPDWAGCIAYDEFASRIVLRRPPPLDQDLGGEWTQAHDLLALKWIQGKGVMVKLRDVEEAVQAVAIQNRFHPVRDWLDGLKWDGIERVRDWLTLYLGVEAGDYVRAVGERWLVSAVARVYRPGCKADCVLVLEGPQGVGKSTALKSLAGEWFTDEVHELGSKDAALQIRGVLVVELAELRQLRRADTEAIKSFVSRTVDRFRPPYGRRVEAFPRQCVFAGTGNDGAYLGDETGGRRFWPVRCGKIHLAELQRDREQLWAEAVHKYKAGVPWWMETEELQAAADLEQRDRFNEDAWHELIVCWLERERIESVSVAEVLERCIKKDKGLWGQADRNRVGKVLKFLRWERKNCASGGGSNWRYVAPEGWVSSVSSLVSSPVSSLSGFE